jgi:hypothetical protein
VHGNHRNRALLDLAYELPCTLGLPGVCEGGVGEPCHSNQSKHGKGGALKAHDHWFAAGCRACHRELDQGKRFTREEKAEFWERGHIQTMNLLWLRGLIRVA